MTTITINNSIELRVSLIDQTLTVRRFVEGAIAANKGNSKSQASVLIETKMFTGRLTLPNDPSTQTDPVAQELIGSLDEYPSNRLAILRCTWKDGNATLVAQLLPDTASPSFGTLTIKLTQQSNKLPETRSVLDAFAAALPPLAPKLEHFVGLSEEAKTFYTAQEDLHAQQRAELSRDRLDLHKLGSAIQKEANAEAVRAKKELEDHGRSLEDLRHTEEQRLKKWESELGEQLRQMDVQAHQDARRKNQTNVEKVLEANTVFELSKKTANKRAWVHGVAVIALLLSALAYGRAAVQDDFQLEVGIPAALLFSSTLVFYLVWLREWADSHARGEAAVRFFREDLARASWLVELVFEWRENEKGRWCMKAGW